MPSRMRCMTDQTSPRRRDERSQVARSLQDYRGKSLSWSSALAENLLSCGGFCSRRLVEPGGELVDAERGSAGAAFMLERRLGTVVERFTDAAPATIGSSSDRPTASTLPRRGGCEPSPSAFDRTEPRRFDPFSYVVRRLSIEFLRVSTKFQLPSAGSVFLSAGTISTSCEVDWRAGPSIESRRVGGVTSIMNQS